MRNNFEGAKKHIDNLVDKVKQADKIINELEHHNDDLKN